jgi:N utilization substance protein B
MYAHLNSAKSMEMAEKELMHSVSRTYELYHHLLLLPDAVAQYAQQQMNIGMQKINPTQQERSPNTKFSRNSFIQLLRSHHALQSFANTHKFEWHQEVVRSIYRSMVNADYYQKYMAEKYSSFADDKKLVLTMMENEVEDREELCSFLEEKSIYWVDDLEFALSHALKTCRTMNEDGSTALMPQYKNDDDRQFQHLLLLAAASHVKDYRLLIEKHAQHWEIERIAWLDTIIMITAIAEIMTFASIPVSVTLNEYIEISKYYSTQQSSMFINGILDKVVAALHEQGMLHKYVDNFQP